MLRKTPNIEEKNLRSFPQWVLHKRNSLTYFHFRAQVLKGSHKNVSQDVFANFVVTNMKLHCRARVHSPRDYCVAKCGSRKFADLWTERRREYKGRGFLWVVTVAKNISAGPCENTLLFRSCIGAEVDVQFESLCARFFSRLSESLCRRRRLGRRGGTSRPIAKKNLTDLKECKKLGSPMVGFVCCFHWMCCIVSTECGKCLLMHAAISMLTYI